MNIGIDIDNTITNTREIIMEYAEKFTKENGLKRDWSPGYYNVEYAFGWDEETTQQFFDCYLMDIYRNVSPKDDAVEVIKQLHEKHNIILITSRNERSELIKEITIEWLDKHQISYDKLVMNRTDNMHHFSKMAECIANKIDIMIEDHHDLVMEISEKIPVIMFEYKYNSHVKAEKIKRVNKWLEVQSIIDVING